jgi:hypothetical protein
MECNELGWFVIGKKLFVVSMWIVLFLKVNDIILSCFNVWSLEIDSNQLLKNYVNVSCDLI